MKEIRHFIFVWILFASIAGINAQTTILSQNTPGDFKQLSHNFGPNRSKFNHPIMGVSWQIPIALNGEEYSPTKPAAPNKFTSGTRYKFKLNRLLSLGNEFTFNYTSYKLNLNKDSHVLAIPSAHKGKYRFFDIEVNLFLRINFDPKRGNNLGKYLDLSGYYSYNFFQRMFFTYPYAGKDNGLKLAYNNPEFLNKHNYGAVVRYGQKNWDLFVLYRISNWFNESLGKIKELPRFQMGFHFFPGSL